jgi:transposase
MSDNTLIVGIDVHRKSQSVSLMDRQGEEVASRFRIDNNRPGAQNLVQRIAQQVVAGDFDAIAIAAEATGWYWWHFFQTLEHDATLQQWPLALYALNPRLTANFKKTYVDLDHCDPVDAFVAADRLRLGRDLPAPFHYDELYFPLRCLTRYRRHIVQALAREKAYCLSMLYLKFSEYTHPDKQPFANVFGAASRAVIQEFASLEDIAVLPFAELVEFIDSKGKRRFPDPANNARKLQTVVRDSYSLPQALQQPINLILSLSLQHIADLEGRAKRLNTAIAQALQPLPHTLDTIPGCGPVFSAGIIAEIADLQRFDYDQAKVAKFAGFKWHRHQSADFEAEHTPISPNCNHHLRYYLCEAANAIRQRDPDYAAFYERKYHEVRHHQHKRAIVLTARKLVRLVVRLLTTNQPYRPRRL